MIKKTELLEAIAPHNRGLLASEMDKVKILSAIQQLEDNNPSPKPLDRRELLEGNWRLLYTSSKDLLGFDRIPLLKLGQIYQCVRVTEAKIYNIAEIMGLPLMESLVSVVASFEPVSDRRINVNFQRSIVGLQRLFGYQTPSNYIQQIESGKKFPPFDFAIDNRCYFCKSELHDTLKPIAIERGYPYVIDGVNADDLQDYRPGIQAAKERGARSPLAEVGVTKLEVRQISQYLGLPWWDKPAQPCLSSRFPYGEEITISKLQRVGRAEVYLRKLGYQNIRVRSSEDTARIELPPEQIQDFIFNTDLKELVQLFQSYGFVYVTLDLEGYVSGKLNRVLLAEGSS